MFDQSLEAMLTLFDLNVFYENSTFHTDTDLRLLCTILPKTKIGTIFVNKTLLFFFIQFDIAIQLITNESGKGSLPSEEILAIFGQTLSKLKDVKRLADLRSSLPLQTEISDKIYESELGLRLLQTHQVSSSIVRAVVEKVIIQQGSEIWISPDFGWSKGGWVANGRNFNYLPRI